jgi:hypothetical protein
LSLDYPLTVPAHKRVQIPVRVNFQYPTKPKPNQTREDRRDFRKAIEKFMTDKWANLDGSVILDENKRYEIDLSPGWKTDKE